MAKVLVVEDSVSDSLALVRLLEKDDHLVFAARDVETAKEIYGREKPFDSVIVELGLPPKPISTEVGTQFCRYLLGQDVDIPIFVITGLESETTWAQKNPSLTKKIRGFYLKPIDFMELRQQIRRLN